VRHPLLHPGRGARASVRRHLRARPGPERRVGVAVRAVGGQAQHPPIAVRCRQVFPHCVAAVRRAGVPDRDQRPGMGGAQLAQGGGASRRGAGPGRCPVRDRPGFRADRRGVAGLLPPARARGIGQGRLPLEHPLPLRVAVRAEGGRVHEGDLRPNRPRRRQQRRLCRDEGGPLGRVGLAQPLLRALVDAARPMPGAHAGAAAEPNPAAGRDALPHHPPVPVRQFATDLARRGLHGDVQPRPGRIPAGGGAPPVRSNARTVGPPCSKAASPPPRVRASRSRCSATVSADQPCASSQRACQRSRSRGVGARYPRSRTCRTSNTHRVNAPAMPTTCRPSSRRSNHGGAHTRWTCGFHPRFGLDNIEANPKVEDSVKTQVKKYRLPVKKRSSFLGVLTITRNLSTKRYSLDSPLYKNTDLNYYLTKQALDHLPYILYFDDFRDSIEERIEIKRDADGNISGWLSIMEELFKQTDKSYSVFDLAAREARQRKTSIDRVKNTLNNALTKEWQQFRLDDTESLEINIEYEPEVVQGAVARAFLKLDIVETDAQGYGHYFFIRDRSKGFYWFFNWNLIQKQLMGRKIILFISWTSLVPIFMLLRKGNSARN